MRRVLGVLLVLGIAEIFVLIALASRIGATLTFLLMILTSAAGAWLAKREGAGAWRRVRAASAAGRVPAVEVVDALLVFVAGLLLLLPGFLSDVIGVTLAVPPVRRRVGSLLLAGMERRVPLSTTAPGQFGFRIGDARVHAPFPRGDQPAGTRPAWVRADEVIDLEAEEVWVDEPVGEIGKGSGREPRH